MVDISYTELLKKNSEYLWNPFTQMRDYLVSAPPIIARGEGVKLIDVDGVEYYDGNSSLWVNVHGHNRPEMNAAITKQLDNIAHSTLLGQANIPSIALAERLIKLAPLSLDKVFYSEAGAAAVEIGLKIAFAYWKRIGKPEKNKFVSFTNSYHGDTFGAMSVGDSKVFHGEFAPCLFPCERVAFPSGTTSTSDASADAASADASIAELSLLFESEGNQISCLIVEPIVQGAAGMITMPDGYLSSVAELCREHDVLLFADEVATGFGRTGKMFACEHEDVAPDIMALGKGLTGGYLPLAATLVSNTLYEAFLGEGSDTFFHGHTYTGNALGCAVALASLDLFDSEQTISHVQRQSLLIAEQLEKIAAIPHVQDVRQRGFMVGVELANASLSKEACLRARQLGMITRPLGNVVTFLPPLASTASELEEMLDILLQAIKDVIAT